MLVRAFLGGPASESDPDEKEAARPGEEAAQGEEGYSVAEDDEGAEGEGAEGEDAEGEATGEVAAETCVFSNFYSNFWLIFGKL